MRGKKYLNLNKNMNLKNKIKLWENSQDSNLQFLIKNFLKIIFEW